MCNSYFKVAHLDAAGAKASLMILSGPGRPGPRASGAKASSSWKCFKILILRLCPKLMEYPVNLLPCSCQRTGILDYIIAASGFLPVRDLHSDAGPGILLNLCFAGCISACIKDTLHVALDF